MISYSLTRKERRFFDVAKSVARTSDFHYTHVGCAVTYKNNIISVACNSEKTHTYQKIYNKFRDFNPDNAQNKVHAEIHALSWLIGKSIDWTRVELYVYREWKNGMPAISKPCNACMALIKKLGIKNIFYVDSNGRYCKERFYY